MVFATAAVGGREMHMRVTSLVFFPSVNSQLSCLCFYDILCIEARMIFLESEVMGTRDKGNNNYKDILEEVKCVGVRCGLRTARKQ